MSNDSSPVFPYPGGTPGDEPPDPIAGQPGHLAWSRWVKQFLKNLNSNLRAHEDAVDPHPQYIKEGEGGGGVSDHGALTGLSDPDHPISAVQGLQTALNSKADTSALPAPSSATPAQLTPSTGAAGTGTAFSRSDHRHQVSTGTPGALGFSAAPGTANALARSDHVHPFPTAAQVGADASGTATTAVAAHAAASDPHPDYLKPAEVLAGTNVTVDLVTNPGKVIIGAEGLGVSDHGDLTGLADPDHPISAVQGLQAALNAKADSSSIPSPGGVPAAVSPSAGAAGVASTFSRSDHQHQAFTGNPVALGAAIAPGTANSLARADHVHPFPTAAQVGADASGTAASAVAAHTAAADPHPQYLTQAEGDALYGDANADQYATHKVRWNGTGWRYRGATIFARPSIPAWPDADVLWDTSQDPTFTSGPPLAVIGDKWLPHGDVIPSA